MLSIIMLSVIILSVIMLSVILLSVIMLSVLLSVIMLVVVAPDKAPMTQKKSFITSSPADLGNDLLKVSDVPVMMSYDAENAYGGFVADQHHYYHQHSQYDQVTMLSSFFTATLEWSTRKVPHSGRLRPYLQTLD
jgi:hypothetical protein